MVIRGGVPFSVPMERLDYGDTVLTYDFDTHTFRQEPVIIKMDYHTSRKVETVSIEYEMLNNKTGELIASLGHYVHKLQGNVLFMTEARHVTPGDCLIKPDYGSYFRDKNSRNKWERVRVVKVMPHDIYESRLCTAYTESGSIMANGFYISSKNS